MAELEPISSALSLRDVGKVFGAGTSAFTALQTLSLDIGANEFFTLLGPSGCGKTTLLRLIAGFDWASSGQIMLFGQDIAGLPANRRPVNTVFQHFALFPHMTVAENVAFALRRLRKPEDEIRRRTGQMLELVHLSAFGGRLPSQLSGGQQQRVALARALAPAPKLLLLDEPLSALDLKLRQSMRRELKQLQLETGITFIFVTHDQGEALAMSDRIAILSAGRLQQVGRPADIYERPANRFVADFIGDTNLIAAMAVQPTSTGTLCRTVSGVEIDCVGAASAGTEVTLSLRPERLRLGPGGLPATLRDITYLGEALDVVVQPQGGPNLRLRLPSGQDLPTVGGMVSVLVPPGTAVVLEG
jgi:spermidine/putrescine transport system ATP-binding protein